MQNIVYNKYTQNPDFYMFVYHIQDNFVLTTADCYEIWNKDYVG